ncbi:MAG TPA: hypothetical protein DCM06_00260 [Comamonadaceae bacterium]|nr:hypothetical protein [Comamonadaceae bacterium]
MDGYMSTPTIAHPSSPRPPAIAGHTGTRPARQRGSVVINVAIALSTLIILLIGTELGYLFYQKRELQKAVDLAALAGAQAVAPLDCSLSVELAKANANGANGVTGNLPPGYALEDADITCGRWDPAIYTNAPHFSAGTTDYNALQVNMRKTPPSLLPFFPGTREIEVQAVAMREEPLTVFSVATTLVNVGCHQQLAPLVQLLKIVGVGDPCVTVGGYEGLVGAQVSASGLLKALGLPLTADLTIADVNDLLAAETVKLGFLLETALTLGGHTELLDLNAELLSLLGVQLGVDALNIDIPLGAGPDGPGIFAGIHAPDGTTASALDVQLDVLDIVTAAVGVGTSGHAVDIPGLNVQIPGILPNLLQVQASIIEPPSIGIGGVGATAYNSQVRLHVNVDTAGGLVGGLLQLLGTRIHLPIYVDVARAKGTIEDLTCRSPVSDSTTTIRVDSSVAQACIGKTEGQWNSTRTPICESIQDETLISVLGLLKLENHIKIDTLEDSHTSPEMMAGDTWTTPGNSLNLGTTLSGLVNELLGLLGEELFGAPSGGDWTPAENEEAAESMAGYYLGQSSPQHPGGLILKDQQLGWLGPDGAYDVEELRDRLKADIDRSTQSCLILGLICWTNDEWSNWANDIRSANILSGRACYGQTPEGWVTAGALGNAGDVARFNQCVERELKEVLMEAPPSQSNAPNFLQAILSPLLDLLEAILNPLGNLLAGPILADTLGIELGVNDVNVKSIGCGKAKLVY